jgi:formate dehydrogenase maturation protein FdhE
LVAAETDPRWIEACGACRLYLKVSDERKLPESATVVPLVESAATLDLDIIAEHHGWCTAAPYAALR